MLSSDYMKTWHQYFQSSWAKEANEFIHSKDFKGDFLEHAGTKWVKTK